jgi:deoxyribodipyrimidine photo-lyase
MNVLIWYKRDLRVTDHPALCLGAQAEGGAVLPVYIAEPGYWSGPDRSARQWAFTAETLEGLRRDLAGLGAPLVVRVGEAVEVLARLCKQHFITRIISHSESGTAWAQARDLRVAAWARAAGIDWVVLAQNTGAVLAAPRLRRVVGVEPGVIPLARALRIAADPCPHRQTGGRAQAEALLDGFLAHRGANYRLALPSPSAAERACSRLSPHLAVGAISGAEVAQALTDRMSARPDAQWRASLRAFEARLRWRDQCCHSAGTGQVLEFEDRAAGAARFKAWEAGETGIPYLDACMRYLAASGWLNFQARAMLASVASYQLWLDRKAVGDVLARRFTDYEPAIHWPQLQALAGADVARRLQIFDPVKLGLTHDPSGAFTRRWLPELAAVPDGFLQTPWKWPGAQRLLGRRYPEPIIDLANAARDARANMGALRPNNHLRPARAAPLLRRTRPAPAGQLSLEL